jgi:hypothetical protein
MSFQIHELRECTIAKVMLRIFMSCTFSEDLIVEEYTIPNPQLKAKSLCRFGVGHLCFKFLERKLK